MKTFSTETSLFSVHAKKIIINLRILRFKSSKVEKNVLLCRIFFDGECKQTKLFYRGLAQQTMQHGPQSQGVYMEWFYNGGFY